MIPPSRIVSGGSSTIARSISSRMSGISSMPSWIAVRRGASTLADEGADLRQDAERRPERRKIAAVGEPHGDPASETLQVVDGPKRPAQVLPEEMLLADLGDGGQPSPGSGPDRGGDS